MKKFIRERLNVRLKENMGDETYGDVRCINCHIRKPPKQFDWYKT